MRTKLLLLPLLLSTATLAKSESNGTNVSGNSLEKNSSNSSKLTEVPVVITEPPPKPAFDLQGRWKENQYQRTGLNDFLYQLGMNWFRRIYTTSTNWEDEQTIYQNGDVFRINGFKGPQAEVYAYSITADNVTRSQIGMGESYGVMEGTSRVDPEAEVLITELVNKDQKMEIVIKRARAAGSNKMIQTMTHMPSSTTMTAVFFKQ